MRLLSNDSNQSSPAVTITKQAENKYIRLDGDKRVSRSLDVLSTKQVLDTCHFDDAEDCNTLTTAKDRKKQRKKQRIARKKEIHEMGEAAIRVADQNRKKQNLHDVRTLMAKKLSAQFLVRLEELLDSEGVDMETFHDPWDGALNEPYNERVTITTDDGRKKDFDITRTGSDVSAVSHNVAITFVDLFQKLKANQSSNKIRRKRRQGPGQSTHLGKPGFVAGILMQRGSQQDKKMAVDKAKKSVEESIEKLKVLLDAVNDLKVKLPSSFWKWDVLKGSKRTTLLKLFGMCKSTIKATEAESVMKNLALTRQMVDEKVDELKATIASKQASLPALVAKTREHEDFLDATAECDVAQADDAEGN